MAIKPKTLTASLDRPDLYSAKEILAVYNNVMAELIKATPQQRYKLWEEICGRLRRLEALESKRRIIIPTPDIHQN